jgi:hypothetical protein
MRLLLPALRSRKLPFWVSNPHPGGIQRGIRWVTERSRFPSEAALQQTTSGNRSVFGNRRDLAAGNRGKVAEQIQIDASIQRVDRAVA